MRDVSLVAWCCAHYPNQCDFYGFARSEAEAWHRTWAHYQLEHAHA